jgi:diguanylate cyclase (GGDEF)-like protein
VKAKPQWTYALAGIVLGAGAPVGALIIRMAAFPAVRLEPLADLRIHTFFYAYELLGSCLVFALGGLVAGSRVDRIRRAEEFYHRLADHDPLTGLLNARAFADRHLRTIERARRSAEPVSMLMIDVDDLKGINDRFGHAAGNEALLHVADAINRAKRDEDVAARWGGDEFAVLLEGGDTEAAVRVAESILQHLRSTPAAIGRSQVDVTVTIGVASSTKPNEAADLFANADRALYAGKNAGRNRVVVAGRG